VALAQALYNGKNVSIAESCKSLRVSRSTLYPYIRVKRGVAEPGDTPTVREAAPAIALPAPGGDTYTHGILIDSGPGEDDPGTATTSLAPHPLQPQRVPRKR